jgi:formyltetrahydrofolate synthetase
MAFPSDLQIAQRAHLIHINQIAEQMGLDPHTDLEHYGKYIAKPSPSYNPVRWANI